MTQGGTAPRVPNRHDKLCAPPIPALPVIGDAALTQTSNIFGTEFTRTNLLLPHIAGDLAAPEVAMIDALAEHIAGILSACEERGMQPPFIFCAATRNGSVVCIRMAGDEDTVLAQHFEPEGFTPPISCMVLDQTGEAVRVTIDAEDLTFH